MATITISYDGRSSVIKQLIAVLLTLGAKVLPADDTKTEQALMVRKNIATAFSEIRAGKAKKNAQRVFAY